MTFLMSNYSTYLQVIADAAIEDACMIYDALQRLRTRWRKFSRKMDRIRDIMHLLPTISLLSIINTTGFATQKNGVVSTIEISHRPYMVQ